MISVASGAGRRAEVATYGQRVVVHAGAVLRELVRRDSIALHVGSVPVTASARCGNVERVYLRARVAGRAQSVHAMAINANRHFRVTFSEKLSVDARLVLTQLIGSQGRIVLAHEIPIGVAAAAELRDLTPQDFPVKAGRLAHGVHVGSRGIPAVAARARQTLLGMNVAGELFFGDLQRGIERTVAVEASVLRLRGSRMRTRKRPEQKHQRSPHSVI